MGVRRTALYPGGWGETLQRFTIGASTTAGALCGLQAVATVNTAAEAINATTTACLNTLGLWAETKTYSTTQSDFDGYPYDEEGTVGVISDPFQVIEFLGNSGATDNTALNSTAPANILTNTSASAGGTVCTAAEVGTVDMSGGLLYGKTGNNVGLARRLSSHSNNTSCTVTVPFPRAIAVNDTFFRVPWSKGTLAIQLITNLTKADAIIVQGTGVPFNIVNVIFDLVGSNVLVQAVPRTAWLNSLA